jgi:transposase
LPDTRHVQVVRAWCPETFTGFRPDLFGYAALQVVRNTNQTAIHQFWPEPPTRVIAAFGAAKPHCAYVFANKRANRMKILLCDGFGIWLLARRLHQGRFVWSALRSGDPVVLDDLQLQALASGLPWQYAGAGFVIDRQ